MVRKFLLLTTALCAISAVAYAAPKSVLGIQGGDIQVGAKVDFDAKDSIVSYYKEGTEGTIDFVCDLSGENVKAFLFGGKNFVSNTPDVLVPGLNGPYSWKLTDMKDDGGNIKVRLMSGTNASVQCRQVN